MHASFALSVHVNKPCRVKFEERLLNVFHDGMKNEGSITEGLKITTSTAFFKWSKVSFQCLTSDITIVDGESIPDTIASHTLTTQKQLINSIVQNVYETQLQFTNFNRYRVINGASTSKQQITDQNWIWCKSFIHLSPNSTASHWTHDFAETLF